MCSYKAMECLSFALRRPGAKPLVPRKGSKALKAGTRDGGPCSPAVADTATVVRSVPSRDRERDGVIVAFGGIATVGLAARKHYQADSCRPAPGEFPSAAPQA